MEKPKTYRNQAPASVVQLDSRPTSNQEVAGSIPAGSAIFFRGDLTMNYFSTIILSLPLIQEDSCQFLAKECAQ